VAEDVTDLVINLIGNSTSAVGAYERATVAGTEAVAAAERAGKATLGLGEASSTAAAGVQRLATQQLSSGASVKAATNAQRELTAAVATNNRANAEQVAYMRATADAARREALAMGEATASEKAMRDAALRNAEAMNVQATAAGRAASAASREGAAQLQAGRQAVEAADKHHAGLTKLKGGLDKAGLGVLALIGVSLKLAGDFQKDTSVLVTAAGESASALGHIRTGLMQISADTGTPLKQLTEGMYLVEKAGYRDADALKVMSAASQGAREENANLATVTNAMTGIMASYNIPASQSVQVMNALKTASAGSKTTMEEYGGALSTVLPIASAAHLSFAQVGGAIAALTRHSTTVRESTQELNFAIRALIAPNAVATNTMAQFGISATEVSQKLGQRGVTGTMQLLIQTLAEHTKGGLVQIGMMRQSASATDDLNKMMLQMSPAARQMANDLQNNTITVKDYRKEAGHLDPAQSAMARQFATLSLKAKGFSDAAKAGLPVQATMESQLKKMTGGAVGLQTGLMLSGSSMAYANGMTRRIGASMSDSAKNVEGWTATQKLANIQTDRARQSLVNLAIQLGTALMPAWIKLTQIVRAGADWLSKHQTVATALAVALGTVLVGGIVAVNVALLMLAANPVTLTIMAVVAGVALLVAGFVAAWQHSESFRDVVLKVIDVVKTGFYGAVYLILGYVHMLVEVWGTAAHSILHAAAMMLGWVPGLGGKLKAADRAFSGFKDGALDTISKLQDGMKTRMDAAAKQTAYQSALTGQAMSHGILDRLPAYQAIADKYGKTLPQVLKDARLPAGDAAKIMTQAVDAGVRSQLDRVRAAGQQVGAGVVEGVAAHVGLAGQTGQNLAMSARGGVSSVGGFDTLGANAGQGYVNGMQGMIQQASNAGANIAAAAMAAVQAAQQSHSPSRMFHNLGRHAGQGYAHGMRSTHGMISEAARDAVQAARDAIADRSEHHGGRVHHPRHHSGGATPHAGHPHQPHQTRAPHHGAVPACIPVCKPKAGQSKPAPTVVHMHVHLDGREIHRSVQMHELQYQGRNPHPSTTISRGSSRAC